jgi:hypothetical protein
MSSTVQQQKAEVVIDRNAISKTPQVLERYELKYTIPFSMVAEISDFIKPYCSLDEYSEKSEDSFYVVNSLYFDSPRFHFLENKMGEALERFNMRIRSYGYFPKLPYFLEIKKKRRDIIKKYRAKIYDEDVQRAIEVQMPTPGGDKHRDKNTKNADLFRHLRFIYAAEPKVLVQYRRKAYFSNYDEYARVTFDVRLRSMELTDGYAPVPIEERMYPADNESAFDIGADTILELKCYTKYVPLWMMDIIKKFNLRQRGFSKYQTCLIKAYEKYNYLTHMNVSTVPDIYNWDLEDD